MEMEKEAMVQLPLGRLEELLEIETRANVLMEIVQGERYVGREMIATCLNFKLHTQDCAKAKTEAVNAVGERMEG